MEPKEKHCQICFAVKSEYVCPQCGISYCSTDCFRNVEKHLKCSEEFYKRCVLERMEQEGQLDADEKEKSMKEILKRFHEQHPEGEIDFKEFMHHHHDDQPDSESSGEEPLDSDDDEALESRLGEIDLDDAEKVWDQLTKEERDDFLRMVKQAKEKGVDVTAEPWYPDRKLVEETPSSSKDS